MSAPRKKSNEASSAAFREKLSNNANTLDLGCCQFYFDKLPE